MPGRIRGRAALGRLCRRGLMHEGGATMGRLSVQLVCSRSGPGFLEAERRIKKWCYYQDRMPLDLGSVVVERETRLDSAFDKARQLLHDEPCSGAVVVSLGFDEEELEPYEHVEESPPIEVILFRLAFDGPNPPPSASLLGHCRNAADPDSLFESLQKASIRLRIRQQGIVIREIGACELDQYFRLRYDVYQPKGYIPREVDAAAVGWELHYSDRWSLPLGAFDRDGQLIGCARLVWEFGCLNNYSDLIQRMVDEKDDPIVRRAWQLPDALTHPFDLLKPFDRFEEYYKELVRRQVLKAEVSRVIRLPRWRGHRLGEVIVDSLVSDAMQRGFQLLFLACEERHRDFYGRSGFRGIPGMWCERFAAYPVAAIAMDRWLVRPPEEE